jgi:ribosomal protein S18 acetylase RimI-like enzyme
MSLLIAAPDDLDAIMELFNHCIVDMQNKSIDQWGAFYPTQEIVKKDIKEESLYLLEIEGEIAGVVTLNEEADPLYSTVQWLADNKKPLIVHRLAVAPTFQGRGYACMMMQWVEEYAKSHDYTSIRLDAYQGNPAAIALYENNEYAKTGEVIFPRRSLPFNCYEKVLDTLPFQGK